MQIIKSSDLRAGGLSSWAGTVLATCKLSDKFSET